MIPTRCFRSGKQSWEAIAVAAAPAHRSETQREIWILFLAQVTTQDAKPCNQFEGPSCLSCRVGMHQPRGLGCVMSSAHLGDSLRSPRLASSPWP
jgi:hypothetical protein